MNTTIEAVKDEVARSRGFSDSEEYLDGRYKSFVQEVAELYHTRKCEEAVRELSDNDKIFENARNHFIGGVATDRNFDCYVSGQKDMRRQASALLGYYQVLLDKEEKAHKDTMAGYNKELVDVQSQLEAKDKEIGQLIDSNNRYTGDELDYKEMADKYVKQLDINTELEFQLQEAKVEVDVMKTELIGRIGDKIKSMPKSSEWSEIVMAIIKEIVEYTPHLPSTGDDNTNKG